MKIPKVKKLSKDEIIDMLKKEIIRKDKIINDLKEDKKILMKIKVDAVKEAQDISSKK